MTDRLRVFWIEGLPGSGKTTLINGLVERRGNFLTVFPKTDIVSIFVRGLGFDFSKFASPGADADCAIEDLKVAMLNSFSPNFERPVVGERSYLSTLVFYDILNKERKVSHEALKHLENHLTGKRRDYVERFIFFNCNPNESLRRDLWSHTGFWNNANHAKLAIGLYEKYLGRMNVPYLKIPAGTETTTAVDLAEDFIYG